MKQIRDTNKFNIPIYQYYYYEEISQE